MSIRILGTTAATPDGIPAAAVRSHGRVSGRRMVPTCPEGVVPLLDLFRLDDRVAVVTGSGRGIGRGIALGLADAGADVVVTGRRTHEVEAVVTEVLARG